VTVLDTSAVVDYLLGVGVAQQVQELIGAEGEPAAPDVLVFEVLAVLRRESRRGAIAAERVAGAVEDLGDISIELFPSLPLRERVWALRVNLTAADALFVALAEDLEEPLATKDGALAREIARHTAVRVLELSDDSR
jgi:predicted nucleic acid-binding protein